MVLHDKIRKIIAQEHRDAARCVGVPPSGGKRLEEVGSMNRQPTTNNHLHRNRQPPKGGTPTNVYTSVAARSDSYAEAFLPLPE
jgi:hypothetical protein